MSTSPKVTIVRTGLANLASVLAGLRRAGADPTLTEDPRDVDRAPFVMLPGVGAYGPAMEHLEATGLADALRARLAAGRPSLCICLGLQLLGESSEETPGVRGLAVVPMAIRRFPATVRVPQFGWNRLSPQPGCRLLRDGYAYFANSFCSEKAPPGWHAAMADHGIPFVAAMERGAVLCCQFHPELSGAYGQELLRRWLTESPALAGA